MRRVITVFGFIALLATAVACVDVVAAPDAQQEISVSVSGRYQWAATDSPDDGLTIEAGDGLLRRVAGDIVLVDPDGSRLRVVVDVQPIGQGTVGSVSVTNEETGRTVHAPVGADPARIAIDENGMWQIAVKAQWASVYRGRLVPFDIDLTVDMNPVVQGPTSLRCAQADGTLIVAPGLTDVSSIQQFSMAPGSGLRDCVTPDGKVVGNLVFEDFAVEFASLGCADPNNSNGVGSATLVWPDGSKSFVEVIAIVTQGGAVLTLTTTSGLLAGNSATLQPKDVGIAAPACSAVPQTSFSFLTEPVEFKPTIVDVKPV